MDIWREISLLLPYLKLAINKNLLTLYDDTWFRDKLKCKQHNNSWKLLYKRSLQSGIFVDRYSDDMLPVEGVKIAGKERFCQLILTFDRTLYFYNSISKDLTVMDENVTDICNNYYIKGQEWYDCEFENKLVTKSKEDFLMVVASNMDDCAAITNNIFYFWDYELIEIKDCNLVKLIYNGFYLVQDINGIVKKFDYQTRSLIPVPLPKVRNLYSACVVSMNNKVMEIYDEYIGNRYLFQSRKINVEGKIREALFLRSFDCEWKGMLILLDNNLYTFDTELKLIRENVKNLLSHRYYMIEKQ